MLRRILPFAICLVWCAILPLTAAPLALYTVENYDVAIRPNLADRLLYGEAKIRLHTDSPNPVSSLQLDAGALQIESVLEGTVVQYFERDRDMLFVVLSNPLRGDTPRTITVRYQAGPGAGLKFFPDQVYTSSATSDWMPCNCGPGERATLHLTVTAPPDAVVAASGQLSSTRANNAQSVTEWRLDSPTQPSSFGFALGSFKETVSDAGGVKLRVLAGLQIDTKPVLEPTAGALRDLNERTGKRYPGETYTQVFVRGDAGRPLAGGLTLLPESYAQSLAAQPGDCWLIADELAHQWFGVAIANDRSDLWLSEGISAFAADAFLGGKFGKERFEREVARSRQIYNQLRAERNDEPLSNGTSTVPSETRDGIAEHKGAWFLYLVDQLMGDNAFWNGVRLYASNEWARTATSQDLQKALDGTDTATAEKGAGAGTSGRGNKSRSAPKALDNLFDAWVYGIPSAEPKSKSR